MTRPACSHCDKRPVQRPRGLCWTCYYTPGVRERYTSGSRYAKRGVSNGCIDAPLPPVATLADPGSEEKIAILAQRAALGQALHHPRDAKTAPPPTPWTVPGARDPGASYGAFGQPIRDNVASE